MILCNDEDIGKRINSAVFPGLQGGPLMHAVAAKAVALGEALQPSFADYARAVVDNAQTLAATFGGSRAGDRLRRHRYPSDAGRSAPAGIDRSRREQALERAGITCNKNGIPFDPQKPTITSGIRLGSPAEPRAASAGRVSPSRRLDRRGSARPGAAPGRQRRLRRRRCVMPSRIVRSLSRSMPGRDGETGFRRAPLSLGVGAQRRKKEEENAAVRSAARMTPRSRIRGRPTIAARSDGGAFAPNCAARFTTFERVQSAASLTVVKKNGQPRAVRPRQARALDLHSRLRKRPHDPKRVERMINSMVRQPRKLGRDRDPQRHDRRIGHGGAGARSIRSPISALPRSTAFPRGQGFRRVSSDGSRRMADC